MKGTFAGIEVLTRGSSPRILSAYVLGSAGRTLTSGAELAARLGLDATWAYFSVKRGTSVVSEPDRSGASAPASPRARDEHAHRRPLRPRRRRAGTGRSAGIDRGGRRGRWVAGRGCLTLRGCPPRRCPPRS